MSDPTPEVTIKGPVEVTGPTADKVTGEPPKDAPKIEKVSTTTETTTTSGTPTQPPPPAAVADDGPRQWLAIAVIVQFLLLIGYIIYQAKTVDNTQMILGAEIGFVTTVLNYYFGSSSGSTTARSALIDQVKR